MAAPEELPDEVKRLVVTRLASFDTPSEAVAAVKEEFALDITRQRVEAYDPTKVAGKGLSKEWRAVFEETRKAYLEDTADIGIAQKTWRLRMLERLALKAANAGNVVLVATLLEQAAKEVGGAFTNRRELSGADGGPIKTKDETPAASKETVLNDLAGIFRDAAFAVGAAPAKPDGDDPVVRKGPRRGRAKKPRPSKARKAVAGAE